MVLLTTRNLTVLAIFMLAVSASEGWWGSSSSGSNNGGGSGSSNDGGWLENTWDNVKEKAEYAKDFVGGAKDMADAYTDMREANWKDSDKYFHARGNNEAANRGQGGADAAKIISDLREDYGKWKGDPASDRAADQEANEWGRNGGDPNKYRPDGLPDKYKK